MTLSTPRFTFSSAEFQLTPVSNQVIATGDLEARPKASAQLQEVRIAALLSVLFKITYRGMLIPCARVHDSHLDPLAEDAPVVKLADSRGIVRRIVAGGGVPDRRETLDGREGHALVGPGANNTGEAQQAVDAVVVGLDTRAREDVRLKVVDDLDIGSQRDIAACLVRALGTGMSITGPPRMSERGVGKLTAAYSIM